MSSSLTEFLLARIAEDEAVARAAVCQCGGPVCTVENGWYREDEAVTRLEEHTAAAHVMRFSPARVLAECEAKRRIVRWADMEPRDEQVLYFLALPYADHADYDEGWKP